MRTTFLHILALKAIRPVFFTLLTIFIVAMKKPTDKGYNYLALGDSYTIGEQVEARDNFPNQLRMLLEKKGIVIDPPQIIAQTGWTTDELQSAVNTARYATRYDLVTLLIGVNNQYRGRKAEDYAPEFERLLKNAIGFAGDDPNHVIVLSIPDWGVTPFAEGRDRQKIAGEIDEYNSINEEIAKKYGIHYINITESTRAATGDPSLLAPDGLHPSGKEYAKWAGLASEWVASVFKNRPDK
jgi:lysophospholipase L1-like esterase